MSSSNSSPPKTRPWVVVLGVLAIFGALVCTVAFYQGHPNALPMNDFVQYWSAAKVNLAGGNPYDANELRPLQSEACGKPDLQNVTMMWNPPWTLVLVTPLGFLPPVLAQLSFQGLQLIALLTSVTWLWTIYGGARSTLWVAWTLALFFGPSAFLLWWGQIGGLVLLGLAGFLRFRDSRPLVAGAFLALTAIKPHLLFAFGLVVALEAIANRTTRRAVLGAVGVLVLLALSAWLMNPGVYAHYRSAGWETSTNLNVSPKDWRLPLFSYWLRMAVNPAAFWIQFTPMAAIAAVTAVHWWRNRSSWSWSEQTPRLVFLSVLATSYGAWVFDLVVLLVPVCAVAAKLAVEPGRKRFAALAAHVLVALVAVGTGNLQFFVTGETMTGLHFFIWVSPAVLALCWWARRPVADRANDEERMPAARRSLEPALR